MLAEAYDRAGFHAYHLAEHHGTPLGLAPSPSVFLAAVAQRTTRLRLGPLVYTLALYNPVRLAEEVCMLDALSGGRLELGVGRGISPIELRMLGVDPDEAPSMYAERLEILLRALSSERLDFQGEYHVLTDARMELRPGAAPASAALVRPRPQGVGAACRTRGHERRLQRARRAGPRDRRRVPRGVGAGGPRGGGPAAPRPQPPPRDRRHRRGGARGRTARLPRSGSRASTSSGRSTAPASRCRSPPTPTRRWRAASASPARHRPCATGCSTNATAPA